MSPIASSLPSCSIKDMLCKLPLWCSKSSSTGYHQLRLSPLRSPDRSSFSSFKKRKNLVPVIVAGRDQQQEGQVFLLDPHILDHWLFQDLLEKTLMNKESHPVTDEMWPVEDNIEEYVENGDAQNEIKSKGAFGKHPPIWLACDVILFEFFIWLVENDDPSLRDLNLNDLMEFYSGDL